METSLIFTYIHDESEPMFNLDNAIETFKQNLERSPIFMDHTEELAQMILDEVEELSALGYSNEIAFKLTVMRFESVKKWAVYQIADFNL